MPGADEGEGASGSDSSAGELQAFMHVPCDGAGAMRGDADEGTTINVYMPRFLAPLEAELVRFPLLGGEGGCGIRVVAADLRLIM